MHRKTEVTWERTPPPPASRLDRRLGSSQNDSVRLSTDTAVQGPLLCRGSGPFRIPGFMRVYRHGSCMFSSYSSVLRLLRRFACLAHFTGIPVCQLSSATGFGCV